MKHSLKQRIVKWVFFSWLASLIPLVIYCVALLLPVQLHDDPENRFDFYQIFQRGDVFVITLTLILVSVGDLYGAKTPRSVASIVIQFIATVAMLASAIGVFYIEYCHRIHQHIDPNQLFGYSVLSFIALLLIGTICLTITKE
jgi:ethanolamine transporter EutH